MKKQLVITAGIVLSACSNSGHQNGGNAYNAPQYMGGQYQMNGHMGGQMGPMGSGCAPAPVPMPCSQPVPKPAPCAAPVPAPMPCAAPKPILAPAPCPVPAPLPVPCAAPAPLPVIAPPQPCAPTPLPVPCAPMLPPAMPEPCPVPTPAPLPCGVPLPMNGGLHGSSAMPPQPVIGASVAHHVGGPSYNGYGLRTSYSPKKKGYAYGELGLVNYDAGKSMGGIQGRVGYQSAYYIGAEVEGSIAVLDEKPQPTTGIAPPAQNLGVKNSFAGFAVARTALSKGFNLLSRVGYHKSKEKIYFPPQCGFAGCVPASEGSVKSDGLAYGIGLEKEISPNNLIRADVTRYDMDSNTNTALSLGYQRKF